MSENDKDGLEFGGQQFEPQPPLTAEEIGFLKQMHTRMGVAEEEWNKWLREIGNRKPQQVVSFKATVRGDALKKLMFLFKFAVEGSHTLTKAELAGQIIELGIEAINAKLMHDHLGHLMKGVRIIGLPEEMRDAVVTKEIRDSIATYIRKAKEDGVILSVNPEIEAEAPVVAEKPRPLPVTPPPDRSPVVEPSSAVPEGTEDGAEPPFPPEGKCQHCGMYMKTDDRCVHEGKWMHHDCAIDAWEKSRNCKG